MERRSVGLLVFMVWIFVEADTGLRGDYFSVNFIGGKDAMW